MNRFIKVIENKYLILIFYYIQSQVYKIKGVFLFSLKMYQFTITCYYVKNRGKYFLNFFIKKRILFLPFVLNQFFQMYLFRILDIFSFRIVKPLATIFSTYCEIKKIKNKNKIDFIRKNVENTLYAIKKRRIFEQN